MTLFERIARKGLSFLYKPVRYAQLSYSQEGEDRILESLLEELPKDYRGFYVDIGAHHPWRFSNTFLFYQKGWKGINVDATPGSMQPFHRYRRKDVNLEFGIGPKAGQITFYCFNDPALNTFDEGIAASRDGKHNYRLLHKSPVDVLTLEMLLDKYLPAGQNIDFLSIDVEGLDLMVLESNNWMKYKPLYVLVEEPLHGEDRSPVTFLEQHGYSVVAKTPRTVFLKKSGSA